MSSAILYLAIIAIWACVLIPRWLKRGAIAPVAAPAPATASATEQAATPDIAESSADDADETPAAEPVSTERVRAEPISAEESRRRMLTARRRLLMMLTGLEIAATALALTSLAAVWVAIPPTVMLAGYLLLLREAAKADAERAQHEAEAAAHARERASARARTARRVIAADGMSTVGAAAAGEALAAKLAAAPVPADYEDGGRDFAPGLAGKYTTSNADADLADEDYYDSYELPRLRAVGD
ncbi:hypothetical protein EAS64_16520 [Trebonia kvetii]|uniref:Uncharacterized protein n=1 Tax=Trebonia kvetii TaxID=2480626 RepID=A0A6P2C3D3_9ACTN|nr:hypothetical protein [Trebonia kvetii]TVZ04023.1 hypothetical protein EAS64_16520 [Trebonia kvetii]